MSQGQKKAKRVKFAGFQKHTLCNLVSWLLQEKNGGQVTEIMLSYIIA